MRRQKIIAETNCDIELNSQVQNRLSRFSYFQQKKGLIMSERIIKISIDSSSIDDAITKIRTLKKEIRDLEFVYNTGNILGRDLDSAHMHTHDHNKPQIKA